MPSFSETRLPTLTVYVRQEAPIRGDGVISADRRRAIRHDGVDARALPPPPAVAAQPPMAVLRERVNERGDLAEARHADELLRLIGPHAPPAEVGVALAGHRRRQRHLLKHVWVGHAMAADPLDRPARLRRRAEPWCALRALIARVELHPDVAHVIRSREG